MDFSEIGTEIDLDRLTEVTGIMWNIAPPPNCDVVSQLKPKSISDSKILEKALDQKFQRIDMDSEVFWEIMDVLNGAIDDAELTNDAFFEANNKSVRIREERVSGVNNGLHEYAWDDIFEALRDANVAEQIEDVLRDNGLDMRVLYLKAAVGADDPENMADIAQAMLAERELF